MSSTDSNINEREAQLQSPVPPRGFLPASDEVAQLVAGLGTSEREQLLAAIQGGSDPPAVTLVAASRVPRSPKWSGKGT